MAGRLRCRRVAVTPPSGRVPPAGAVEPVVVDLADECPHGGTVPGTAGGNQAESSHLPAAPRGPGSGRPSDLPKGGGSRQEGPPSPIGSIPDKSRYQVWIFGIPRRCGPAPRFAQHLGRAQMEILSTSS